MRGNTRIKGRSMIELVLVMFLLILFSVATLSLVIGSSNAYRDTIKKNDTISNLRISQAYIHTKIRQNLEVDAISLRDFEGVENAFLVIKDNHSPVAYETIIFVKDGYLREALIIEGFEFDLDSSFPVVELDEIYFELIDQKGLSFETTLNTNGSENSLTGFIALPLN